MKSFINILVLFSLLLFAISSYAQVAKGSSGTFALTNATIETVTNGTQSGTLVIQDGKITAIGESVSVPEGATTIDCSGLTIYPGMIDGGTRLGLSEVGSVSLTQDYSEVGDITPQMKALTAVNPNSVSIPVTRVSGVTTALAVPSGGIFPGTAVLIHLHGYTPAQMFGGYDGIVLRFPVSGRRSRFDRRSEEDIKKAKEKALERLNDTWEKAILYAKIADQHAAGKGEAPAYNPEMAALAPATQGKTSVLIEVNAVADIRSAIEWVEKNKVKAVFTGVAEGWRAAKELAEAKIPVITGPVLSTPTRAADQYDRPYANAGLMHKAGVKVAIRTNDAENVRNLPFNAGFAATYGMGKEAALRAITIVPAEIFGLEEQIGSLEVGKVANLFVADGDPFEPKTQIRHLFIRGWDIPLDSRHIQLYQEFLERSPGVERE
ncbi:MAG: amidohydrolase family protein [Bacteroidota bacterium]